MSARVGLLSGPVLSAAVLLCLGLLPPAAADIFVIDDEVNATVLSMNDAPSAFGPVVGSSGLEVRPSEVIPFLGRLKGRYSSSVVLGNRDVIVLTLARPDETNHCQFGGVDLQLFIVGLQLQPNSSSFTIFGNTV